MKTTEEILNIDCRKPDGKEKLNRFLWKIKPFSKLGIPKGCVLDIGDLERVLHGISIRYGYRLVNVSPYYEDDKTFIFFKGDITKKEEGVRQWHGSVYGVTMWELIAKSLIKIYSEIQKERKKDA